MFKPDYENGIALVADGRFVEVDAATDVNSVKSMLAADKVVVLYSNHTNVTGEMQAWLHGAMAAGLTNPVILRVDYGRSSAEDVAIMAAADLGTMLLNGFADGVWIRAAKLTATEIARYSFGILHPLA